MKNFALDLWNDLRQKRLLPVALVLGLLLLAVPVVLSKPAEKTSTPEPAVDVADKAPDQDELKALTAVKLEDGTPTGSTLGVFDPSDPFRPPTVVVKRSDSESAGAGPSKGSDGPSSGGGSGDQGGSGGGSTGGDTGGSTGGSTGGDTGGSTGGDTGGSTGGTKTTTTQYTYVADVTFSSGGHTRKIKGLQRLDMLPSQDSPLLIFLGVSENGGNTVFLVDSTLDAAGEGKCKPRAAQCGFLYLGPGSEEEFTNEDGDSYRLRIDQIRKVEVGASASASKSSHRKANAAVGAPGSPRRFVPPVLSDLVSVSTRGEDHSTTGSGRR